jgi:hypothetical protein
MDQTMHTHRCSNALEEGKEEAEIVESMEKMEISELFSAKPSLRPSQARAESEDVAADLRQIKISQSSKRSPSRTDNQRKEINPQSYAEHSRERYFIGSINETNHSFVADFGSQQEIVHLVSSRDDMIRLRQEDQS